MEENDNLIRVYTGTEVTVNLLRAELEANEIPGIVQNNFSSGLTAGFSAGALSEVQLYIQELDLKRAEPIIIEFLKINQG